MIQIRRSEERGNINHGWLHARHTFSFGEYHDDRFLGFRTLRVINEDVVQAGQGFGMHPHKNMEILTYILEGALEHKDSMGNLGSIRPGDVQYMSAGTGVVHSEVNASKSESVHLLQIWILPKTQGGSPSYGQKNFPKERRMDQWCLIASPDGREDSITIGQDAFLFASLLGAGKALNYSTEKERYLWLQVARGGLELMGKTLEAGDGVALYDITDLEVKALQNSEFLLFNLN